MQYDYFGKSEELDAARKRIAAMDEVDDSDVTQGSLDQSLRTILTALHTGMHSEDKNFASECLWDVVAMLLQLEEHLRERC